MMLLLKGVTIGAENADTRVEDGASGVRTEMRRCYKTISIVCASDGRPDTSSERRVLEGDAGTHRARSRGKESAMELHSHTFFYLFSSPFPDHVLMSSGLCSSYMMSVFSLLHPRVHS